MITIDLAPGRRNSYGITHESRTAHRVTPEGFGDGHKRYVIVVWDNTIRPNTNPDEWTEFAGRRGPGAYIGPDGKGTDDATSFRLRAEVTVIGGWIDPDAPKPGDTLAVGTDVQLRYPDGNVITCRVTASPRGNPVLIPAAELWDIDNPQDDLNRGWACDGVVAPTAARVTMRIENHYGSDVVTTTVEATIPLPPSRDDIDAYSNWKYDNVFCHTGTGREEGDAAYFVEITESTIPALLGQEFEFGV